jgi:hypothetical protein
LWCFNGVRAGRSIEMDRPVTNWPCLPPPLKRQIFPLVSVTTNRAAVAHHGQSTNIKRTLTVDCGMVDFFSAGIDFQLGPPIAIQPGYQTPRRPNFSQNMHPIKRCRRSLARPNRTTPKYPDVNNGVAVRSLRWFCFIPPIAFVGGIGG